MKIKNNFFQTIDPVNGNILDNYFFLKKKDIIKKLYSSHSSFQEWKNSSFNDKIKCLKKLCNSIKNHLNDIAFLITQEMGKPIFQSYEEIEKSISLCKYYSKIKDSIFLQKIDFFNKNENIKSSYIKYEPMGTILLIVPWNYPVWQIIRSSIPNLILGNSILIKPALNTIGTSIFLEKIFLKSGFPKGLFQILTVENKIIESIISDDIIQGVSFTGSSSVGKIIGSLSGKYIKKSILELGGNDAFIVLKDVKNIKKVAKLAVKSRLNNTGQSCISAKRFIVDKKIINDFIDLVIQEMKTFEKGDLYKKSTKIGYIAREDLSEKLYYQYKDLIFNGGKICLKSKKEGNFFFPSLLKINNKDIFFDQEEIFGPIGIVIPFLKEKEIPFIVNNTCYGLGASIWTDNLNKAEKILNHINTGLVFINKIVKSYPLFPFGGVKKSGYGRELSIFSIKEFSNWKTIVIKNDL